MQVHTSLPTAPLLQNCALTIGTFDGVHRGHRALTDVLQTRAAERGLPTVVLTFRDMPHCFFRPDDCPRLLTLPEEKIAAFENLKIDHLFIVPFDASLAEQSYDDFTRRVLVTHLGMKLLVIGPDFALGKNRAGDIPALNSLGRACDFCVRVLDGKLEDEGEAISSTRVRGLVENGEVERAGRMLGRAFSFTGEVVAGKQLGRTIGVPTINLKTHSRKVLPRNGIYAARAIFDDGSIHGSTHRAALSVGTNPTTDSTDDLKIEFHVIGEHIETPHQSARLEVLRWLRGEQKFASLDELVIQMQRDIEAAKGFLS